MNTASAFAALLLFAAAALVRPAFADLNTGLFCLLFVRDDVLYARRFDPGLARRAGEKK
jgi:hypothetical protein